MTIFNFKNLYPYKDRQHSCFHEASQNKTKCDGIPVFARWGCCSSNILWSQRMGLWVASIWPLAFILSRVGAGKLELLSVQFYPFKSYTPPLILHVSTLQEWLLLGLLPCLSHHLELPPTHYKYTTSNFKLYALSKETKYAALVLPKKRVWCSMCVV